MTTQDAIDRLAHILPAPVPNWQWSTRKQSKEGQVMLAQAHAFAPEYHDFHGYEYHDPPAADVCKAAGVGLDEGVIATVLTSEVGNLGPAYLLAVAHAIINDSDALFPGLDGHRAPDGILRRCTGGAVRLRFGRQAGGGMARYCSSFQPPTLRTLEAARLALQGVGADLAQGARRWVDFRSQDGGTQAGDALPASEAVLRSRYADGWRLVPHDPRVDSYELGLLAHEGVDLATALLMLADGRARAHASKHP